MLAVGKHPSIRILISFAMLATVLATTSATAAPKPSSSSVTWTGNGLSSDRSSVETTICAPDPGASAEGEYLFFVLASTQSISSATINIGGSSAAMTKANTSKRGVSSYRYVYAPGSAINPGALLSSGVSASYSGLGTPTLTVSHGCVGSGSVTSYTITASAGANGTISPTGSTSVSSGGSQTFTFTPDSGYEVASVTVDGSAVTTASSYTFSNVTTNHSISVTFAVAAVRYTITASSGGNGTISPSGSVSVASGDDQTFTFTPDSGYAVSSVVVDGSSVGSPASYTFSSVTANHTISVSFARPRFMLRASGGWDEGNANYAYSVTCDGVSGSANSYLNSCSNVQVVVKYDDTSTSPPGGMPLVSGRNRWQYLYASSGLTCTETQQLTTLPYSSTFDCAVTGADTYFVAMGVAVSWSTSSMAAGTSYVLYHNYIFFSPNIWAGQSAVPGTAGLKFCAVVSGTVTAECYNVPGGTSWPGLTMATAKAVNTWQVSLLNSAVTGETYTLTSRSVGANVYTVSSGTPATVTTTGESDYWYVITVATS
jgi:hypothetical protein